MRVLVIKLAALGDFAQAFGPFAAIRAHHPGARITLDGNAARIADSAGRVSFPVARGRHALLVEADGYPPFETVVVI